MLNLHFLQTRFFTELRGFPLVSRAHFRNHPGFTRDEICL